MKKITAVTLALLMLMALATTSIAMAENTEQKLTVWCWDPSFNIYAMEEAAKVYQQENPGFVLEVIETPWDDLQTKLTTAAMSGQLDSLPDIFLCQNNAFQKNLTNFPELFADLTGSAIAFDQFPQSVVAFSTVDGKNYGIPFDNGTAITALRTDVLAEAGYTIDDFTDITWEEYMTLAEDVLAKTGKALLSSVAGETDTTMMMLQSAASSLFNQDGSVNIVDNQALKDCIALYVDMAKKGLIVEVNSWDEYISSFTNETVAGTINGCWILGSVQSAADQSGKWDITNLPRLDVDGATNYSANGGSSWAISSNCANLDLATDFFAKTFAGSGELYETILPTAGAIANWLPAGESPVYQEPQPFFGGDAIYAKITEYAAQVPSNNTGVYYYEARDAVGVAITQIIQGADVDTALAEAQSTVEFAMGN